MIPVIRSYVCGEWVEGRGERVPLVNPATEAVLAEVAPGGFDSAACLHYARRRGGPALRAMTFVERGKVLAAMSAVIHAHRDELIEISITNGGNTRSDAKFDIDGAAGTLTAYAAVGQALGAGRFLVDGDPIQLGRSPRFMGQHIRVPLTGAAVQVNAFNFPAWGFAEKAAVALLAGMPVVSKPATSSVMLAHRIVEILQSGGVLADGALSFIAGGIGDLLDHLTCQDVLAFTGSSETGARIRSGANIIRRSVRVNIEADSLNAAVLGPDVGEASDTYELFLREVGRDITQKAGQKCTAIRRVFVAESMMAQAKRDLTERIAAVKVGDPSVNDVRMGPLATASQLDDVRAGIERLQTCARVAYGGIGRTASPLIGVDGDRGYFQSPVLLDASPAEEASAIHSHEVFGPVATLMPYRGGATEAAELVCMGEGGLVSSVYTDDRDFAAQFVLGIAPYHGRVNIGSGKVAEQSPGPGTVLPQLVHGGPGRAGGGEELGGTRGLALYTQRAAIQGYGPLIERVVKD